MSVSIRGCPKCNSMLLGDSAQCPHCGHVLDASRATSDFLDLIPASELKMSSEPDDELACRQCGEMVRLGLVRCWHCGAFTNPEIEATYQRMQANPPPIMFSDTSNAESAEMSHQAEQFQPQYGSSDDGGFELQEGYFPSGASDDFSVAPNVTQIPPAPTPANYGYQSAAPQPVRQVLPGNAVAKAHPVDQYATQPPPVAAPPRQPAFDQPAFDQAAYDQAAYEQAAYDQAGYDQAAYDQAAYDQAAYDQAAYDQAAYDQAAYDQAAYDQYQQQYGQQQAAYDPNAQPGEPGYYDPNAAYDPNVAYDPNAVYDPNASQQYAEGTAEGQEGYATQEGYAAATDSAPPSIPELPGTATEAAPTPAVAHSSPEMPPAPDVAHSVSTGGEALLQAAIEEEKQSIQIRKMWGKRRASGQGLPPGAFLIFCPNGHKVQVHDRHRGRAGRCPNCKAVFFVPVAVADAPTVEIEGQAGGAAANGRYQIGAYTDWIFDLRLHTISPTKLKLKPGAMAGEYDVADVAFSESDMLVATVFKRGGTFAGMQEKKKKPATRLAVGDYLQSKKPVTGLPVPFQTLVTTNDAPLLKIVQPATPGEESIFAGIPVFGPGRIVVRLPAQLEGGARAYLSFALSEFREFARLLELRFGIVGFGLELGIPLTDITSTYKCHYSDLELVALENVEFYQNDPKMKPVVIGRKCAGCGLVVSEDARKKEKIGGKTDVSIAKATCPKCKKKFGDTTFYGLDPKAQPIVIGMLPKEG